MFAAFILKNLKKKLEGNKREKERVFSSESINSGGGRSSLLSTKKKG